MLEKIKNTRVQVVLLGIYFIVHGATIRIFDTRPIYFVNKQSGNFESNFAFLVGASFIVFAFWLKKK